MLGRDKETITPISTAKAQGTILSKDVEFKGSLTFKDNLRIDGKFEGDISSAGTIHIGESGEVKAEIKVGHAVIEGEVHGNVIAEEKIELLSSAQLFGDIKASRLAINEGVVFVGKCEVNPSGAKIEVLRPAEEERSKNRNEHQPSKEAVTAEN